MKDKRLRIFVHYASELLTDYEPHGDGLICFSLLNGLASRGHDIFAYTSCAALRNPDPHLRVRVGKTRVPSSALSLWEHGWRANQWFKELEKEAPFDLVWRLHPYGDACPLPPRTDGRPLVVGPMFYAWTPADAGVKTKTVHRFGIGILHLVRPIARWGWRQTLRRASLLICATPQHAKALQAEHPQSKVIDLPVIVAPPPGSLVQREPFGQSTLRLALVGTLADYRRPLVFCQLVHRLRAQGIPASGTIIGSGPMRAELEQFCNQNGLSDVIRFLGKIPTAEVLERVREADLLVNLCVVEAYGRNVIEAMAVGTPAVCAASAGPADLIEDNVDGLLVRPPVAEEYARRIAELWRKPALWEKLSAAALRKTLGWWPDAVLDRLESAMIELVASRAD